ncbi:C-5 cytosine-specific DNA methylase superfamily protein [Sesbania bispinosa]|nr:C-5 cytosine-specific DNA methylase superfamily protein [Sesbania bispinosa]
MRHESLEKRKKGTESDLRKERFRPVWKRTKESLKTPSPSSEVEEGEERDGGVETLAAEEGVNEVVGELEGDAGKGVGMRLKGKWTILKEIIFGDYFERF